MLQMWLRLRCLVRPILASIAFTFVPVSSQTALAQAWPSRTVTVVVPFGPGTSLETIGRPLFEQLSKSLGQPIVIENRPGAGGTTGAAHVARAEPDGHTVLIYSSSFSISHSVHPKLPYDTLSDFIPTVAIALQPNALVVPSTKGLNSIADLVADAKARPGALNYASIGIGSAPHVAAERFRLSAGFQAQHVPFRGPTEALTETMTGRIDFYFPPLGTALPLVREGKLKALAVSTSNRAKALPEVPTTVEAGLKDSSFDFWMGLFLPKGTSPQIVAKLHSEVKAALDTPLMRERMSAFAFEPLAMTQAEFAQFFRNDIESIGQLVQKAGIKGN